MNIRWRLSTLLVQVILLFTSTYIFTGSIICGKVWYISGLFAIILSTQLFEPFFSTPRDAFGNSIAVLFLAYFAPKTHTQIGWLIFAIFAAITASLALFAMIAGSRDEEGRIARLAKSVSIFVRKATALSMYSIAFWLDLFDFRPLSTSDFWIIGATWLAITILSTTNWQILWAAAKGRPIPSRVEAMIGPSILLVSAPHLPKPGTHVRLHDSAHVTDGFVITRILRFRDALIHLHVLKQEDATHFLRAKSITIESLANSSISILGSVQQESSIPSLKFLATRPHQLGQLVAVPSSQGEILYQITMGRIVHLNTKGGSHLVVETSASQLGIFDPTSQRVSRYRWVPDPGAPVVLPSLSISAAPIVSTTNSLKLGNIIGSQIPIYLDTQLLCESHLAILGMTRMGKTTFAHKLTTLLARNQRVTVLDLTGEYVSKRGYTIYTTTDDNNLNGVSVLEISRAKVAADEAYKYLERLVGIAETEYRAGNPRQRTVLIDEAHQFIPEPAGLGFNAPGRENAYKFGVLMMQVRKYGICVVLISQRTAVVAKSALSQCENLVAFKSVDQTGLDYLEQILGENARPMLPLLKQGEALVSGPAISSDTTVAVKIDP